MKRQPAPLVALGGAFALLVLLMGAARVVSQIADSVLPRLAENVHVIAYLRDDMTADKAQALAEIVSRVPGVERVRAVDSAEALARLRAEAKSMGGVAEFLDGVEEGFLPRSLEVRLQATTSLSERAVALAERLRRIPGIAEVDAMEDGLARLRSVLGLLRGLGWSLFGLAVVAGVAVLVLPLVQGRQRRQQEVAVLTLLGETPAGIRRPWALAGGLSAVAGALSAWLVLWLAHLTLSSSLAAVLGSWVPGPLPFVAWHEMLLATVVALFAGFWIGQRAMPSLKGRYV
ncbi:MAG: permease-like cell division protein FtsX [Deltaproteobacteria bacterium]|nr:permease-like cell division protein FtsX [Deltaproteobacteria bacterium]